MLNWDCHHHTKKLSAINKKSLLENVQLATKPLQPPLLTSGHSSPRKKIHLSPLTQYPTNCGQTDNAEPGWLKLWLSHAIRIETWRGSWSISAGKIGKGTVEKLCMRWASDSGKRVWVSKMEMRYFCGWGIWKCWRRMLPRGLWGVLTASGRRGIFFGESKRTMKKDIISAIRQGIRCRCYLKIEPVTDHAAEQFRKD